jgi:hypothetical protein
MRPAVTCMDSGPWNHPVEMAERKGLGYPDISCAMPWQKSSAESGWGFGSHPCQDPISSM